MMLDNVGEWDTDEATKFQTGEGVFQLFLKISSKLENIILFKKRITHYHTCANLAALEAQTKDKRIRRIIGRKSEVKLHEKNVHNAHVRTQKDEECSMQRKWEEWCG